jgi:hypothetical protein
MSTPRQRFVDRITRFRNNEFLALNVRYSTDADEPHLRQLCSNDPRLHDFHVLVESLSDEEFAVLLDTLLTIASAGAGILHYDESAIVKDHIKQIEMAARLVGELSSMSCIQDPPIKIGSLVPPDEPVFLNMFGHLCKLKEHLCEQQYGLQRRLKDCAVSRKKGTVPQETFMAEAPTAMIGWFGKPHYEIVADLTSALYGAEISADAVKKALYRHQKAEQECERRDEADAKRMGRFNVQK